ncbi:hypothetical protein ACQZV8_12175 [Magnetococcales bacterium HHB-1]
MRKDVLYRFTLEDGSQLDLPGNTLVKYEGKTQTAANLYLALMAESKKKNT